MKTKITILLAAVVMLAACSSLKKSTDAADSKTDTKEITAKTADKAKTDEQVKKERQAQMKAQQKQRDKENAEKRKQQIKEQKKLEKESAEKKKKEAKAKKAKEKEQLDFIKNAKKNEKKRIEEERKKEKEALLGIDSKAEKAEETVEAAEENAEDVSNEVLPVAEEVEKAIESENKTLAAEENAAENKAKEEEIIPKEEKNIPKEESGEAKEEKKLSTMDIILAQMQNKNKTVSTENDAEKTVTEEKSAVAGVTESSEEGNLQQISDKEKKKIIEDSKKADKKGNFIKNTYRKVVPEHVDREVTFPNMYKEKPRSIMILMPWNRSDYKPASKMLFVSATEELGTKGYYVLPSVPMLDIMAKDTMMNARYAKSADLKQYAKDYGVDAVLYVTIYRCEKPWWSTKKVCNAHYAMISTKTLDTLFARDVEFEFDTQMPAKESTDKDLVKDQEEQTFLSVMVSMQQYVFMDIPVGPYHTEYNTDQKKYSNPKEVKYKVNERPS